MRINEYNSLEEFTSEYTGVWSPSSGHWFGLDFRFNGVTYRLHTGPMYKDEETVLPDGREAVFGLYRLINVTGTDYQYTLLGKYADMNDLLESTVVEGRKFRDIIMDDMTEMLGKD